jgi:hypothetical protein
MQKNELEEINNNSNWPKPENPTPKELADDSNIKVVQDFFTAY